MNAQAFQHVSEDRELRWREHDGGKCPLPYSAQVYLRFASGIESRHLTFAGFWESYWRRGMHGHGAPRDHITHYRVAVNAPARLDRIAAKRRVG